LRFGYIIGSPHIADTINKLLPCWNINSIVESLSKELLRDKDYLQKSILYIEKEKEYLLKELSSFHAVKRVLPLLTGGMTVAVIGVGGLGHMAIQELKAVSPVRILAYDLDVSSLKLAEELGADEALKPGDNTINPMSVDAVLDFVGAGATITQAARMIRPLGHIVVVGRGPGVFEFRDRALPYGVTLSTTFGGAKIELIELIGLAEAGLIKPHITRFKLDDVEVAYDKLARGEIKGRGVIIP